MGDHRPSTLRLDRVADDKLVYAEEFGVRKEGGGEPVDTRTVFQIGSASKGFLATTMAIAVDRGELRTANDGQTYEFRRE